MATEEASVKAVQVKLVLLGEAAVGKSSLVLRFVQNDFNENTSPTIGAAFLTQKCRLENRVVKFEIWDTAGQERFHSLAPMYYRNAQAAVVVYDITKAASLDKAKAWVKELQRQASPNIVIALVGNKLDLVSESSTKASDAATETEVEDESPAEEDQTEGEEGNTAPAKSSTESPDSEHVRQVSYAEAEAYAKESHLLFFEASARTGQNVGEVFTEIAKTIPLDSLSPKPAQANARRSAGGNTQGQEGAGVNLSDGQQAKKGGCC